MSTAIIHIGVHKTGTTAIQNSLLANRQVLNKYGYDYLLFPNEKALRVKAHDHIAGNLRLKVDKSVLTNIGRAIANPLQNHLNLLLSAENFFVPYRPNVHGQSETLSYIDDLGSMLKGYDHIRVVCYLRRQDLWMESFYLEYPYALSKLGLDFQAYREQFGPPLYKEQIDAWAKLCGPENLALRLYEADRFTDGDVRTDFYEILDVPSTDVVQHAETFRSNNITTPRDVYEYLRIFLAENGGVEPIRKSILADVVRRVSQKFLLEFEIRKSWQRSLTYNQRLSLLEDCRQENEAIRSEYFPDFSGDLFKFDADKERDLEPYPGLSPERRNRIHQLFEAELNSAQTRMQVIKNEVKTRLKQFLPV
tara:strand:+ start:50204 stop:51295 length:1092 start_codon:yes stop_codon:yes gene_type:complete